MSINAVRSVRLGRGLRWSVIVCLLINAGIHLYLTPMHLREAPYIGVGFVLLSLGCLALVGLLLAVDDRRVWAATGGLSLAGLIAFVASRTTGLPVIGDEVGNWSDPFGVVTVVVEVATIAVATVTLRRGSLS